MYKSPKSNLLNSLSNTLPDDRPITSILVVEFVDECPPGYVAISRTYDQDSDADLWRDSSFLKKKSGRYLCLSKTEGTPDHVITGIYVFPENHIIGDCCYLTRTVDSGQKAWRKKQISYKLDKKEIGKQVITDIIICSRLKKAPEGFYLAGNVNGLIVCFKMGNVQDTANSPNSEDSPNGTKSPTDRPVRPPPPVPGSKPAYPVLDGGDNDYELLNPNYVPTRPAPQPPGHNYNTLGVYHSLDGVPFRLNPRIVCGTDDNAIPKFKTRTSDQVDKEFFYDFSVERQT